MNQVIEFTAVLKKVEGGHAAYVDFPFDVKEIFGTRGNVKVKIMYDEVPHRGLLTNMGGACHFLGITKDLKARIGKEVGDTVHIRLEKDLEERIVEVPEDLAAAFATAVEARTAYEKLSYTHRREYVQWILEAKRPETRVRRIAGTIERLLANKKEPYG